jgi:hypothetical protein
MQSDVLVSWHPGLPHNPMCRWFMVFVRPRCRGHDKEKGTPKIAWVSTKGASHSASNATTLVCVKLLRNSLLETQNTHLPDIITQRLRYSSPTPKPICPNHCTPSIPYHLFSRTPTHSQPSPPTTPIPTRPRIPIRKTAPFIIRKETRLMIRKAATAILAKETPCILRKAAPAVPRKETPLRIAKAAAAHVAVKTPACCAAATAGRGLEGCLDGRVHGVVDFHWFWRGVWGVVGLLGG